MYAHLNEIVRNLNVIKFILLSVLYGIIRTIVCIVILLDLLHQIYLLISFFTKSFADIRVRKKNGRFVCFFLVSILFNHYKNTAHWRNLPKC